MCQLHRSHVPLLAVTGIASLVIGCSLVLKSAPGLRNAFSTLSASGLGDPTGFVSASSEVLPQSALGTGLILGGLSLLVTALIRFRAHRHKSNVSPSVET